MKKLLIAGRILLALIVATPAMAGYESHYRNLPVKVKPVTEFTVPANTLSLTDFGGKGDGITLNTEAFAKAINALTEKGGGRLIVPQGVWLTGPIELKSNIDLHLDKNAIVYFSPDKELYIDRTPKAKRVLPCITATRCKNICITGEGIIDGNGTQWRPVKRGKVSDEEWKRFKAMGGVERQDGKLWYPWNMKSGYPDIADTPERQEGMRNDIFRVFHCENILLRGVTFQNSPKFHVHPFNSRNIIIDGITVRCPWNAQNGDAIDLSDCHQALIINSTVDAGDDGLCMKSSDYKEGALVNGCEDILIENNTVYHAHGGFVIGSEDVCGMKRIVVRNCRFAGTDTGLRFKSGVGRGGKTEDIYISGIVMTDIAHEAVVFQCDYVNRPAGGKEEKTADGILEKVPEFTDIHISDVICRNAGTAISAKGIEGLNCVHGITIKNSTFVYNNTGTSIDNKTAELKLTGVKIVENKK